MRSLKLQPADLPKAPRKWRRWLTTTSPHCGLDAGLQLKKRKGRGGHQSDLCCGDSAHVHLIYIRSHMEKTPWTWLDEAAANFHSHCPVWADGNDFLLMPGGVGVQCALQEGSWFNSQWAEPPMLEFTCSSSCWTAFLLLFYCKNLVLTLAVIGNSFFSQNKNKK